MPRCDPKSLGFNSFQPISSSELVEPSVFYRAHEFVAVPSLLEISRPVGPTVSLLLYGRAGVSCQLQSTPAVSDNPAWNPELTVSLTNSFQFIQRPSGPGRGRFFRTRE